MIIVSEIDAYVDQPNKRRKEEKKKRRKEKKKKTRIHEYKNTRIQEYKKKKLKLKNQRDVSDFEKETHQLTSSIWDRTRSHTICFPSWHCTTCRGKLYNHSTIN